MIHMMMMMIIDYYFPKSYTIVGQSSFQGVMLKFGHRCNLNHLSGDEFCIVCNLLQVDFYQWEIFRGSWDFWLYMRDFIASRDGNEKKEDIFYYLLTCGIWKETADCWPCEIMYSCVLVYYQDQQRTLGQASNLWQNTRGR